MADGRSEIAKTPCPLMRSLEKFHDQIIDAYLAQEWKKAHNSLEQCRASCESYDIDEFYDLYEVRIVDYQTHPPDNGWDGVFVATSK